MRNPDKKVWLSALFIFLTWAGFAQQEMNIGSDKKARFLITLMQQSNFEEVYQNCDSTMKRVIRDAEGLKEIWDNLLFFYGDFKEMGTTVTDSIDGYSVTQTVVSFEKAKMGLRLTFDTNLLLSGLYVTDAGQKHEAAAYIKPETFFEVKVSFGVKAYPLEGVLSVPVASGKHPCVVIVGGSGPVDGDLSLGPNKIYKDLAWGLASQGICVFRYPKRTYIHSEKMKAEQASRKSYNVQSEYLEDIQELLNVLKSKTYVDAKRIFILGHSEGGMLAPLILQQNTMLAGAIMMAAPVRSLQQLMLYQYDYLMPDSTLNTESQLKKEHLKRQVNLAMQPALSKHTPDDSLPDGFPASYWNYLEHYNQASVAQKVKKPVFIVQGNRDYQVPLSDFLLWQDVLRGKSNFSFTSFEKLNHLFLEGSGLSTPGEYARKQNVPEYCINELAKWLLSH